MSVCLEFNILRCVFIYVRMHKEIVYDQYIDVFITGSLQTRTLYE